MLILCDVHCFLSSCVNLSNLLITAFRWYNTKVFANSYLHFVKNLDADGTIHKFRPLLVTYWIVPVNVPMGGRGAFQCCIVLKITTNFVCTCVSKINQKIKVVD